MLNLSDRKILKFPHCVFPIRLPRSVFKRFHTQLAFYTFHQVDSIDAWPLFDTMTSADTVNSTTNVSLINISPSTETEMLTARKLIVGIFIIQTIKLYFLYRTIYLQMDASIISCIITLVTTSIFLHINYFFKLLSMVLTVIGHLTVFALLLADGIDSIAFTTRYFYVFLICV